MKIGRIDFGATHAPNEERLRELTGQSVEAMRGLLEGELIASTVARALAACIAEGADLAELTERVVKAGVDDVRRELRRVYARAEPAEEKKSGAK